jgi:hypothetical protein
MRSALKFTKQSLNTRSKHTERLPFPLKVYFGDEAASQKMTNEFMLKEIKAKFGEPSSYVKKGDFDVNLIPKIKALLDYKKIENDQYFEVVKEAGGYESIEEVKKEYQDTSILEMDFPKYLKFDTPVETWNFKEIQPIDKKVLEKFLSMLSKAEKNAWSEFLDSADHYEKEFKIATSREMEAIDWVAAEKIHGEEKVFKIRENFHKSVKEFAPTYDAYLLFNTMMSYIRPVVRRNNLIFSMMNLEMKFQDLVQ